ncbi:hypothetical protein QWI17_07120 [Gilvimarinus sp. SDUM040013]|uniref:Uncharacterized protein n=1 Tax=Gilvimarinus gilvus TaxID=3058038 RepID=A0ABU4RYK0_9GAMM|nr:hypothetical protein [Gilvimarinus sp. SDUM040013]MDO3385603.1 hypothetical protein [Gilvimarinus sp. SDUM040013]MDX6849937.1 hypothetical protein [Gilvimarinus sp. SDUM040013]
MEQESSFLAGALDLSVGSIVAGLIAAAVLFRLFFNDFESFIESIKYWISPEYRYDRREMFSSEWWGSTRIVLWVGLSIA